MLNDFKIELDCNFASICNDSKLYPVENKNVLSILNDYENGKWRYKKFNTFLWNNVCETALSKKERDSLYLEPMSLLSMSKSNLNLKEDGGEIGEILLYAIMKHHYNALPIVPKIFYKQNSNDPAKGADSVHIVIENNNTFSIWFGEAKFYNNIEDTRLYEIVDSVNNSLDCDKIKKENIIITNLNEINDYKSIDDKIKNKIMETLNKKTSIDNIKPILHIPILLLYECDITANETHYTDEYIESVKNYHIERANSYFKKQIKKCSSVDLYNKITFHLILFPVPNKKVVIDNFMKAANGL